jgi:SNF2 family DNA or RNA helicase
MSMIHTRMKLLPLWKGFTYFSHQIEGIEWMLEKETDGTHVKGRMGGSGKTIRGGLQCDDMGLGKTIQIASVIINNPLPTTLLVAPLAMIDTWSQVLQKAGLAVYEVEKVPGSSSWNMMNTSSSIPMRFIKMRPKVYITNYEKLYRDVSLFSSGFNRIVLDEAHKIRNGDGEISKAARKIKAPIRWAVTGTPIVNSLKDMVALFAFIGVPYSPLWTWEPRYIRMLPDLVIHRSLDSLRDVIPNAPPVPEINTYILPFISKQEENFYLGIQGATDSLAKRYARELLTQQQKFTLLIRLRQLSVHPQVYINAKRRESKAYSRSDWDGTCTKFEAIKDIVAEDVEERDDGLPHKYLIFCQFKDEMDMLHDYLIENNIFSKVYMYNGSISKKERDNVMEESRNSEENIALLIQLHAGGVGLNIQYCDRIIFMSPWWSDAMMSQAIARSVRMGQTQVVKVYHLCLEIEHDNSINIDSIMNEKAEEKKELLNKVFAVCQGDSDAI